MLVKTYCAAMMGLEATTITIEVNMTRGMMFHLSGLADTAVKESYDRIRAAMSNIGFKPPTADLTINLSPADLKKGLKLRVSSNELSIKSNRRYFKTRENSI